LANQRGDTGIRELRERPVVTTPNVFPPPTFEPRDEHHDDAATPPVELVRNMD